MLSVWALTGVPGRSCSIHPWFLADKSPDELPSDWTLAGAKWGIMACRRFTIQGFKLQEYGISVRNRIWCSPAPHDSKQK
mmetsp:Transcript_2416/g.3881  ORF Transcript_2416/g.3881 Transcript_2416/m.3881 type:complete len:80 (-) Transcript_2416:37-276(-)